MRESVVVHKSHRRIIVKTLSKPFLAIGMYLLQTFSELRKTVTPTVRELAGWSVAVFVFVGLLMCLVTGMDFGLGKLVLFVFG
ncbi:preprotein translocase subunit SecE [Bifidobacterium sp. SO1]|nr:preprotein translocase subunit SecE [Bifidobacterium sp. SO1]